jgi:hypothetical protein
VSLFRLSSATESRLLGLPESGIGFQLIEFRGDLLLAFNASFALPLSEYRERPGSADELARIFNERQQNRPAVQTAELEGDIRLAYSQLEPNWWSPASGLTRPEQAATPSSVSISAARPYAYFRFCATPRDKRVTVGGDFLPGTFATTLTDFVTVPSGYAAVGRYAMPNPASARFVSSIVTFDRPTRIGTATPNFGQAGGGVEVVFGRGATNRSGISVPIAAG